MVDFDYYIKPLHELLSPFSFFIPSLSLPYLFKKSQPIFPQMVASRAATLAMKK